jgi:hypothetical protein
MNTHANKTQENENPSLQHRVSSTRSGGESTFQFIDNRPEATAQRKLQEAANHSPQAQRLRTFQEMANNNPQAKNAAQRQAMADNFTARQQQPIQKKENQPTFSMPGSLNSEVIQRATVSGVRNDGKSQTEIGNDMHAIVQEQFLDSDLGSSYSLYTEFVIGGGRADLVAINDERDEDGLGDCYIYVGEIKSDSLVWYGSTGAYHQLNQYIRAFENDPRFYGAQVGKLSFWNPSSEGMPIEQDGYNCTLFIQNRGGGLYTYTGRVMDNAILNMQSRLDDQEMEDLPFNEQSNYSF